MGDYPHDPGGFIGNHFNNAIVVVGIIITRVENFGDAAIAPPNLPNPAVSAGDISITHDGDDIIGVAAGAHPGLNTTFPHIVLLVLGRPIPAPALNGI